MCGIICGAQVKLRRRKTEITYAYYMVICNKTSQELRNCPNQSPNCRKSFNGLIVQIVCIVCFVCIVCLVCIVCTLCIVCIVCTLCMFGFGWFLLVWVVLVGFGWFWLVLVGFGRFDFMLVGLVWSAEIM